MIHLSQLPNGRPPTAAASDTPFLPTEESDAAATPTLRDQIYRALDQRDLSTATRLTHQARNHSRQEYADQLQELARGELDCDDVDGR